MRAVRSAAVSSIREYSKALRSPGAKRLGEAAIRTWAARFLKLHVSSGWKAAGAGPVVLVDNDSPEIGDLTFFQRIG